MQLQMSDFVSTESLLKCCDMPGLQLQGLLDAKAGLWHIKLQLTATITGNHDVSIPHRAV